MRKHKHLPLSQKIQLRVSRPRVGSSVFLLGTKGWHYEGQVDPAPLGREGGLEMSKFSFSVEAESGGASDRGGMLLAASLVNTASSPKV